MLRARTGLIVAMSLLMVGVLLGSAEAQQRRGGARGIRGSMLSILSLEQVQDEIKLTDEQKAKVKSVATAIREEMRDKFMQLRDIEDPAARTKKMDELNRLVDEKARKELKDDIDGEQLKRFIQVLLQVRPALEILGREMIADRLNITAEQKKKLAEVKKEADAKQAAFRTEMREAEQDKRRELFQKYFTIRAETNKKAISVLTEEQQKQFQEMKGEKFELQMRRPRRQAG